MKTEKIIWIVELDEDWEFRDFLYEETNRIAQEKARKIDCEITKKIRQEAVEELKKSIIDKINEEIENENEHFKFCMGLIQAKRFIESYNLPIK